MDIYGNVIGINTAMSTTADGVAFALPITQEFVDATLKSIIEYNKIVRPLIGIAYVDINSEIQKELKLDANNGIIVKDVFSDLPASTA
ncbi:S1C family serine protease [Patescibacteria group bacterium]|nr:S1C family serine protease [Patescibacteria group bacterium]MBU1757652.1 S1C family serine protease [Patescibacteria group bacterium]